MGMAITAASSAQPVTAQQINNSNMSPADKKTALDGLAVQAKEGSGAKAAMLTPDDKKKLTAADNVIDNNQIQNSTSISAGDKSTIEHAKDLENQKNVGGSTLTAADNAAVTKGHDLLNKDGGTKALAPMLSPAGGNSVSSSNQTGEASQNTPESMQGKLLAESIALRK